MTGRLFWYGLLLFALVQAAAFIYVMHTAKPDVYAIKYFDELTKGKQIAPPDNMFVFSKIKKGKNLYVKFKYPYSENFLDSTIDSITLIGQIKATELIDRLNNTNNISCFKNTNPDYIQCNIRLK